MKSAIFLSALVVLGILVISPTSGYESLYGRTFNLLNLLQRPQNQLKSLLSRYAVLDSALNFLTSQFSSLQTQITSLASQITALTTIVNSLTQPKCPSTAPSTAKIVLGKCFLVFSDPATFENARLTCMAGVGKLAEPAPADAQSLWSALKETTAFPMQTNTVGTAGVWLGYLQGVTTNKAANFLGISDPGNTIPPTSFTPTIVDANVGLDKNNAAVLDTTTGATKFLFKDTLVTTPAPNKQAFICQY